MFATLVLLLVCPLEGQAANDQPSAKTQTDNTAKPAAPSQAHVEEQQQAPRSASENSEDVIARYTIWLTRFTGVLAIATVALAFYTGRLYIATAGMQKLAANQDDLTKILQRAYISVEPDGIRPHRRKREGRPVGGVEELTGHYVIRNVGNLPARDLSWNSGITCSDDRKWSPKALTKLVGNIVVTPGTRVRRATKQIISTDLLLFDGNKKRYCYVWGKVRYTDGLGQERVTDFCHRYNCEALREDNTIPEEHGRIHENGNEAT